MLNNQIEQFAKHWIQAWNQHDIEQIISHYAPTLVFISPLIVERYQRADGTITNREELKSYFQIGLDSQPKLNFKLEDIFYGVKGFTLLYQNARGGRTAEYFELNEQNQAVRVINCYSN